MLNDEAPLCGCGLRMSRNPHPDAGKPNQAGVEVGYLFECIPCLVKTRNRVGASWRKEQAENEALRKVVNAAYGYIHSSSDPPVRQRTYTEWLRAYAEFKERES